MSLLEQEVSSDRLRVTAGRSGVKAMAHKIAERITVDAKVMAGKPVIEGTRIPVETIIRMLAQGISEREILHEYPRLTSEDIRAALDYAAHVIAQEDVLPFAASA